MPQNNSGWEDETILPLLRAGDGGGLLGLIEAHGSRVNGLLRKGALGDVLDETDLRDAMTDGAVHAFSTRAATFDPAKGSLGGWFYRIVVNKALDIAGRKRIRRQRFRQLAHHGATRPLPPAIVALVASIDELDGIQRIIVVMDIEAGGQANGEDLASEVERRTGRAQTAESIQETRSMAHRRLRELMARRGFTQI